MILKTNEQMEILFTDAKPRVFNFLRQKTIQGAFEKECILLIMATKEIAHEPHSTVDLALKL